MGWVTALIFFTWVFTMALTSYHREKSLKAREKLEEVEAAYSEHVAKIEAEFARDIALLQGENEVLRGVL